MFVNDVKSDWWLIEPGYDDGQLKWRVIRHQWNRGDQIRDGSVFPSLEEALTWLANRLGFEVVATPMCEVDTPSGVIEGGSIDHG